MANHPVMFERVSADAGFDTLSGPTMGIMVAAHGDPIDALPTPATRAKLEALRLRALDARSLFLPISDEARSVRTELQKAQARLRQLKLRRGEGGVELADDDISVVDVRRTISRLEGEIARLTTLEQARGASVRNAGLLLQSCETWLSSGRPGGTILTEAPPLALADILKSKERLFDAVERMRHRLREMDASAHRVRSSCFPAADCKKRLRDQIEVIAARGTPDVSGLVEHFGDIGWPMTTQMLPLAAVVGTTGDRLIGNAQGDAFDALGAFVWLNKAALLKALDGLIDAEADDEHALSQAERETRLAEIARDRLVIERQECWLIWHGMSQGDQVEHRADASPTAILGIELVTSRS